MTLRLTAEEVRRARAWAQLLGGDDGRDVGQVASHLVGVQAQDPAASALCIRARTSGLVAAAVTSAASGAGSTVITWTLRGTRHLHHRDDVRWLLGLFAPIFGRPGRRAAELHIAGRAGERALRVLERAVATDGPLTRAEVKERLAAAGIDPTGQAPVHVIRRAALEGALCVVPGPDGGERYVSLDSRVPVAGAVDADAAAVELARRFVASYGPATAGDLAAWSGLPAPVARRAWAAIAAELTEVVGPTGPMRVLSGRAGAVDAAVTRPSPLRLTGAFDTLWLGYADRSLLTVPEHARRVNAGGGMVRPLVVSDGEVVGTWAYGRSCRPHVVAVDPFRDLTASETGALTAEVADVGRFLGTAPELVLQPR